MEVSPLSHITNSMVVVQAIKWLRGTARYQRFAAWMPMAEGKVHALMSAIGALASSVGMHAAMTGNVALGWTITLGIPPLWVVAHALWDWTEQFATNQIVFAIAAQQKAAAPVLTEKIAPGLSVTTPAEVHQ